MQKMRDQAEDFGTRFITDQATKVELSNEPGGIHKVWVGDDEYQARTVVLAMGAEHKKLGVPGEAELGGAGISYCATCDAAFFKERDTIIVGGGDSAMEEAIFLSKFASKVYIVHRRDEFRASKIMLERARSIENIEFLTPYVIEEFHEGEGAFQRVARLRNAETGEERELPFGGAFIAIGHEPQSGIVAGQVPTDDEDYVITEGKSTRTGVPGVFAAGDLVDHTYRQAVTAAGSGCQAALDAEWYLRDTPQIADARGDAGRRPRRSAMGAARLTPARPTPKQAARSRSCGASNGRTSRWAAPGCWARGCGCERPSSWRAPRAPSRSWPWPSPCALRLRLALDDLALDDLALGRRVAAESSLPAPARRRRARVRLGARRPTAHSGGREDVVGRHHVVGVVDVLVAGEVAELVLDDRAQLGPVPVDVEVVGDRALRVGRRVVDVDAHPRASAR